MDMIVIEKVVTSMGIPGIGFAFLGYFLKRYFDEAKEQRILREKELEKDNKDITKLCDKIDKMADSINGFASIQVQKSVMLETMVTDIKDMYQRIAVKQESIRQAVEETNIRTELCPHTCEKDKEVENKNEYKRKLSDTK